MNEISNKLEYEQLQLRLSSQRFHWSELIPFISAIFSLFIASYHYYQRTEINKKSSIENLTLQDISLSHGRMMVKSIINFCTIGLYAPIDYLIHHHYRSCIKYSLEIVKGACDENYSITHLKHLTPNQTLKVIQQVIDNLTSQSSINDHIKSKLLELNRIQITLKIKKGCKIYKHESFNNYFKFEIKDDFKNEIGMESIINSTDKEIDGIMQVNQNVSSIYNDNLVEKLSTLQLKLHGKTLFCKKKYFDTYVEKIVQPA